MRPPVELTEAERASLQEAVSGAMKAIDEAMMRELVNPRLGSTLAPPQLPICPRCTDYSCPDCRARATST
jgi:hypothetical protein